MLCLCLISLFILYPWITFFWFPLTSWFPWLLVISLKGWWTRSHITEFGLRYLVNLFSNRSVLFFNLPICLYCFLLVFYLKVLKTCVYLSLEEAVTIIDKEFVKLHCIFATQNVLLLLSKWRVKWSIPKDNYSVTLHGKISSTFWNHMESSFDAT